MLRLSKALSLYKAASDYNSHLRNTLKILCHSFPSPQTANAMTAPHFSFFPCIWVIPCLLSIRTCDLAVQKLLNTEKFLRVPLVYSHFSTCTYRGRLQITNKEHSVCRYLQQTAARHSAGVENRASLHSATLQVSLGFNLALRISG